MINKQIIQHLFTYQSNNNVKLYDMYREIITHHAQTGDEKHRLESDFVRFFGELRTKANLKTGEMLGVCDDCLENLGWKDKRKYSKILKNMEKSDPDAWNDSNWH
jgi:hypothetical protein